MKKKKLEERDIFEILIVLRMILVTETTIFWSLKLSFGL